MAQAIPIEGHPKNECYIEADTTRDNAENEAAIRWCIHIGKDHHYEELIARLMASAITLDANLIRYAKENSLPIPELDQRLLLSAASAKTGIVPTEAFIQTLSGLPEGKYHVVLNATF